MTASLAGSDPLAEIARRVPSEYVADFPIDRLREHPENPNEGDIGAIVESIDANGLFGALLVQKATLHILSGNHTWKAARDRGFRTIAVFLLDVDDARALKILLAANRARDRASYNKGKLYDVLAEIVALEGVSGLSGTLFDGDDMDRLKADVEGPLAPDEFPEVDESVPTEHECPKCRYRWSGKAKGAP